MSPRITSWIPSGRSYIYFFLFPVALVSLSCEAKPTQTTEVSSGVDPIAQATRAAQGLDFMQNPIGSNVDSSIIGPIRATFIPASQTTEYVIDRIDPLLGGSFSNIWSPVPCGRYVGSSDDDTRRNWEHPHPPCDETTNHSDATMIVTTGITTSDGGRFIYCEYQGAQTGIGTPCRWGDQINN